MLTETDLVRINKERAEKGKIPLSMFEARRTLQLSNVDLTFWDQDFVERILLNIVMSELIPTSDTNDRPCDVGDNYSSDICDGGNSDNSEPSVQDTSLDTGASDTGSFCDP